MDNKLLVLAMGLVVILIVSVFAGAELLNSPQSTPEFFVGVELAYANATSSDVRDLVDKVKDYTNLFVIGSPMISRNETMLNETCDYVYDSGLSFIVLFTSTPVYDYIPYVWIMKAKQKYGDRFLAVYRYDEPGGNVLDRGSEALIDEEYVGETVNYSHAARTYVDLLYGHLEYYLYAGADVITADYGLYWFDYMGGYASVFAEFGSNHSREMNVAACRGAARAQERDWGAVITWTYNDTPYIESGQRVYEDMELAYHAGAKYVVVFNYPKIDRYGILTEEHFDALKRFWKYINNNPQNHGINSGEVAYVLPKDYGFGYRSSIDHVWVWDADELSQKVWDDGNRLVSQYDSRFDIVYNDPEFISAIKLRYDKLFFWNETVP